MIIKRALLFILLVMPIAANAAVTRYTFTEPNFIGGFTFDDSTNTFSNVDIFETEFNIVTWASLTGDATQATGSGDFLGIPLTLTFDDVLGSLPLGDTYAVSTFVDATTTPVGGTFSGTSSMVSSVPIPAAAWLFGSALMGLGALKRRKA